MIKMKPLYQVGIEPYVLASKPITKGKITLCINGCSFDENGKRGTRPVGDLEAVLVIDPHPLAGHDWGIPLGEPVKVIGLREVDAKYAVSINKDGFVIHPELYLLHTSLRSSKHFSIESYQTMLDRIRNDDDFLELKGFMKKFFD